MGHVGFLATSCCFSCAYLWRAAHRHCVSFVLAAAQLTWVQPRSLLCAALMSGHAHDCWCAWQVLQWQCQSVTEKVDCSFSNVSRGHGQRYVTQQQGTCIFCSDHSLGVGGHSCCHVKGVQLLSHQRLRCSVQLVDLCHCDSVAAYSEELSS